jgi:hypothetical protein
VEPFLDAAAISDPPDRHPLRGLELDHVAIISWRMSSEADLGGNRRLDETDVRILRLLEANGRASYEEISRHVHLSANAVRGRVQALMKRGFIRGTMPRSIGTAAAPGSRR